MRIDARRVAPALYVHLTELKQIDNDQPYVQVMHSGTGWGLRVVPDDARAIAAALTSAADEVDRIAGALS